MRRRNVKPSQSKPIKWFHRQAFQQILFPSSLKFTHFILNWVWNVIFTAESSKQKCRFRCAQPRVGKYFSGALLWRRCAFYERSSLQAKSTSLRWNLDVQQLRDYLHCLKILELCWDGKSWIARLLMKSFHDWKKQVRSLIKPGFTFELFKLAGMFNGINDIS